jgi:hypothetical protein
VQRVHILEVAYVALAGGLMAVATAGGDMADHMRLFQLALVVCLPAMVPCLPLLYLAGAAAWNLTGADHGGPVWPVMLTYTAVALLAALLNVLAVRWLRTRPGIS